MAMKPGAIFAISVIGLMPALSNGDAWARPPVPEVTVVVLNQTLETDPGSARAYVQFGKPVAHRDVQDYYPVCYFYLNTVEGGQPQTIAPGEFPVSKATRAIRQNFGRRSVPWEVASLRLDLAQMGLDEYYQTHLKLAAPDRPELRELICVIHYTPDTVMRYHLKLEEIRKALGEVVTLRTP